MQEPRLLEMRVLNVLEKQYHITLIELTKKDGNKVSAIISPQPLWDGKQFKGSFAILTDITERKKAEDNFRIKKYMARCFFQKGADFVLIIDPDDIFENFF